MMDRIQRRDHNERRYERLAEDRLRIKDRGIRGIGDMGYLLWLIEELEDKVDGLLERELGRREPGGDSN